MEKAAAKGYHDLSCSTGQSVTTLEDKGDGMRKASSSSNDCLNVIEREPGIIDSFKLRQAGY